MLPNWTGRPSQAPTGIDTVRQFPPRRHTILLVDDEDMVRYAIRKSLEHLGYQVVEAPNGQEALNLYREHKLALDLVILDMDMPFIDGAECLREMRKLCPELKAILSTGSSSTDKAQAVLHQHSTPLLAKPYNLQELAAAVQKVFYPK